MSLKKAGIDVDSAEFKLELDDDILQSAQAIQLIEMGDFDAAETILRRDGDEVGNSFADALMQDPEANGAAVVDRLSKMRNMLLGLNGGNNPNTFSSTSRVMVSRS